MQKMIDDDFNDKVMNRTKSKQIGTSSSSDEVEKHKYKAFDHDSQIKEGLNS